MLSQLSIQSCSLIHWIVLVSQKVTSSFFSFHFFFLFSNSFLPSSSTAILVTTPQIPFPCDVGYWSGQIFYCFGTFNSALHYCQVKSYLKNSCDMALTAVDTWFLPKARSRFLWALGKRPFVSPSMSTLIYAHMMMPKPKTRCWREGLGIQESGVLPQTPDLTIGCSVLMQQISPSTTECSPSFLRVFSQASEADLRMVQGAYRGRRGEILLHLS